MAYVEGPANSGTLVRMCDISGCEELLHHASDRARVHAHATLLINDIPFLIEFTHNRTAEALRFEIRPQLEPIDRHGVKVHRIVHAGAGVESDSALALYDRSKLVADNILVGFFD